MRRTRWAAMALAASGLGLSALAITGVGVGAAGATPLPQGHPIGGNYVFIEPPSTSPYTTWSLTYHGAASDGFGNHGTWTSSPRDASIDVVIELDGCTFDAFKSPTGLSSAAHPGTYTCDGDRGDKTKWYAVWESDPT